jgi:hypothetical protein
MSELYNSGLIYKITHFNEASGQIIIECEGYHSPLAIDLPIDNGKYPEGDDLDTYIRGFIPTWLIQRSALLKRGIKNADSIKDLVVVRSEEQQNQINSNNRSSEIYQLLFRSDWTQLLDSPLSESKRKEWAEYRSKLRDLDPTNPSLVLPEPPKKEI